LLSDEIRAGESYAARASAASLFPWSNDVEDGEMDVASAGRVREAIVELGRNDEEKSI
jgi:hypothetical protein